MPLPPGYPPGSTLEVILQLENMGFSREEVRRAMREEARDGAEMSDAARRYAAPEPGKLESIAKKPATTPKRR